MPFRRTRTAVAVVVGLIAWIGIAIAVEGAARPVHGQTPRDRLTIGSPDECPPYPMVEAAPVNDREFYFTRGIYSSGGGWGRRGRSWSIDFPKADRQFLVVLRRLIGIGAFPCENAVALDDPELRRFPFLYMLEVGRMGLTPPEVEGLRTYLEAGGFLLIDDFWGSWQWENFELEMRRVLPQYEIVDLPMDHAVFNMVYNVREILQVPSIGNARAGRYWEGDGVTPFVRGIFNEKGRLVVGIVWNSDLGDAWEWAEQPDYPVDRSTFAFQMGVNFIVYAMSH